MRRASVLFGLLGALNTGNGMAQPRAGLCEPGAAIQQALEGNRVEAAARLGAEDASAAFPVLQGLLKQYPDELFIHVQYQDLAKYAYREKLEEVAGQYQAWAESRTEDALYLYLNGRMLTGTREEAAADHYRRALEKDPAFPRAHLALTYVYTRTPERDLEKAKAHLQTFLQLCPGSVEGYSYLGELGDPEFQRSMATEWRRRLQARPGAEAVAAYPALWELEFKLAPPAEHPALRKRVTADLEAIRALDLSQDENWLRSLERGHGLTGDTGQVRWAREQRAARFPDSPEVRIQALEDWAAAHPEPALDAKPAEVEAYYRELLAVSEEWTRRWPEEPMSWLDRLSALSELQEATAAEVEQAGEKLLAAWEKKKRSLQTAPGTVPLRIARAYLRKKAALQRIPELVRTGIEAGEQDAKRLEDNAAAPARVKEGGRRGERLNRWMGWSLLFEAALESGQKPQAREAFAKLEALLRQDEASEARAGDASLAQQRGDYWAAAGALEALEGRKLEALVFYQNALAAGLEDPLMPDWKEARERQLQTARRLWAELGGTPEGWDRWLAGRRAHRLDGLRGPQPK